MIDVADVESITGEQLGCEQYYTPYECSRVSDRCTFDTETMNSGYCKPIGLRCGCACTYIETVDFDLVSMK